MADFVFVYVANPDHGLQRKSQTRLAPILKSNHMQLCKHKKKEPSNKPLNENKKQLKPGSDLQFSNCFQIPLEILH